MPRALSDVAAVILAAGRSTRFAGATTKLVATLDGRPLVRRAAQAALDSRAAPVTVVTGHQSETVAAALDGLDVAFVHNRDPAAGLSRSLAAGLAATPAAASAVVILLADMPLIGARLIDALIDAFEAARGRGLDPLAAAPFCGARRGNPVLVARALFPAALALQGDRGARALLEAAGDRLLRVETTDAAAVFADVDTPAELLALEHAAPSPRL